MTYGNFAIVSAHWVRKISKTTLKMPRAVPVRRRVVLGLQALALLHGEKRRP